MGWGWTEAPRGALGHWIHIKDGKIANYQAIVPSTWNGSPRDANGLPGAYEAALVGTPVADPNSRWKFCAPSTPSTRAWPARCMSWTRKEMKSHE